MRKGATHLAKQAGRRHSARIRNRADGAGDPNLSRRRRFAAHSAAVPNHRILRRHLDEHSRQLSVGCRLERRQRRPRTEHILPQRRLYIRHPNAIEHAANLPAGSAQCPDGNAERRYDKRLSQRRARHKSNGEYTHRQAGGSRRHAHNHLLLHPKRQPTRRNRHAHRHGNGDGNRYAYSHRDGNAYSDVDLHCHSDGNSDIDIYTHRHCHAYRYGHRNGHGNRNADGYTYRYAHRHSNGYTYINLNRHAHRHANAYSYA